MVAQPLAWPCFLCLLSHGTIAQLLMETRTELFSAGSIIARSGEEADRLMVVVSGMVGFPPPPNIPSAVNPPA